MNRKYLLLVSFLVLTIALAACTTQTTPVTQQPTAYPIESNASTEAPAAGDTLEIAIVDFSFSPKDVTIKKGTTVTWTNKDSVIHTATSDTGLFDSGNLSQGQSFSYTFTTAGTFPYVCTPHKANMKATIVVTD
ncbi:MAG TPA: cupredoxin family copper-binding protein [Anaerolineaceae bacterium]|nr:cupredoxin family copper-binding protein [Anaerolineaceae bacterium]